MTPTILVVEDSVTVRAVIGRYLRSAGYQLSESEAAETALSLMQASSFDLVIADINLPQMDGVRFVREVRSIPSIAAVPVLILTSDRTEDIRQRCTEAGANGFVRKPVTAEDLLTAVSQLTRLAPRANAG